MKKRLLSMLLALVMTVSVMPADVFAVSASAIIAEETTTATEETTTADATTEAAETTTSDAGVAAVAEEATTEAAETSTDATPESEDVETTEPEDALQNQGEYKVLIHTTVEDLIFKNGDATLLAEKEAIGEDGYATYTTWLDAGVYEYTSETYGKGTIRVDEEEDIYLRAIGYKLTKASESGFSMKITNTQDEEMLYESDSVEGDGTAKVLLPVYGYNVKYIFRVVPTDDSYCSFTGAVWAEKGTTEFDGFKSGRFNLSDGFGYSLTKKTTVTIYVPEGAQLQVGGRAKFYRPENNYDVEYIGTENGLDKYEATVQAKGSDQLFYKVKKEGYITKAATFASNAGTIEVKSLKDGSDYYVDVLDSTEADMLLNYDNSKFINMQIGEATDIWVSRVWQPIDGITTNAYVDPDFHFSVINGNSVTVDEDGIIRAVRNGVSVVAVTYDAFEYGSSFYNAVLEENVGVFVVKVGENGEGVSTGVGASDFDTAYFARTLSVDGQDVLENDHAEYTFTPRITATGRTTVSVANVYGYPSPKMSSWKNYTAGEDGSYTVELTPGRNIIRVQVYNPSTRKRVEDYHVVHCMGSDVMVKNATNPGKALQEGDTAEISMTNLQLPVPKMAAIYNPGFPDTTYLSYTATNDYDDKLADGIPITSTRTQYGIRDYKKIKMTIELTSGGTWTLKDGSIHSGITGSEGGAHQKLHKQSVGGTYGGEDSDTRAGYSSYLPEFSFTVKNISGEAVALEVIKLIRKIGTVEYTEESKARIEAARKAFDDAGLKGQEFISAKYVETLEAAELKYRGFEEAEQESKIEKKTIGEKEYYVLTSKEELAWFVKLVNGSLAEIAPNSEANAILGNDIIWNKQVIDPETETVVENKDNLERWTAMVSYAGTFDGDGHSISGLYGADDDAQAGLIRTLSGTVKNLKVKDSWFSGQYYSDSMTDSYYGGIAGVSSGIIQNVEFYGQLNTRYYTGGIVGENTGLVKDCYADAEITVKDGFIIRAGGICGNAFGIISHCWAEGSVNLPSGSTNRDAGGIVGMANGTVENCYSRVYVDGKGCVGGIAGRVYAYTGSRFSGSLENCYNAGTVTGGTKVGSVAGSMEGNAAFVANCYGLAGTADAAISGYTGDGAVLADKEAFASGEITCALGDAFGQMLEEDIYPVFRTADNGVFMIDGVYTNANPFLAEILIKKIKKVGLDGDENCFRLVEEANNCYQMLTEEAKLEVSNRAKLEDAVAVVDAIVKEINDTIAAFYPISEQTAERISKVENDYARFIDLGGNPNRIIGIDTITPAKEEVVEASIEIVEEAGESWYVIRNREQLTWFAKLTNDTLTSRAGDNTANMKLGCDIIFNKALLDTILDADGNLIPEEVEKVEPWDGIGVDSQYRYSGKINGNGHTIFGLYGTGFVHQSSEILVDNLSIKDGYFTGQNNYAGGIVISITNSSVVSNCSFDGKIVGSTYAGGIVGSIHAGRIENCINYSDVYADRHAGGIVGYLNTGISVTNCENRGNVVLTEPSSSYVYAGGIAAISWDSSPISYCINRGRVTVIPNGNKNYYVGGIVGNISGDGTNHVDQCVNRGTVEITGQTTTGYIGGIAGYSERGDIRNSYNSGTVIANGGQYAGGLIGYAGIHNGYSDAALIINCYNRGTIESVLGTANTGILAGHYADTESMNAYYLAQEELNAVGEGELDLAVETTKEEFASGKITYLLGRAFGQDIGRNEYPLIANEDGSNWVFMEDGSYTNLCLSAAISLIAEIPEEVTLEDLSVIETARSVYAKLYEEEQEKVTNYDKLVAAEAAYGDALVADIGDVTLDSPSDTIEKLKKAECYEAGLTSEQKEMMANGQALKEKRQAYEDITASLIAQIDALIPVKENTLQLCDEAEAQYVKYSAMGGETSRITNYEKINEARVAYWNPIKETIQIAVEDGREYYRLETRDHLHWFTNMVNGRIPEQENRYANAKLANDIIWNENLLDTILDEEGNLKEEIPSDIKEWLPIGNTNVYGGYFDGQNHTISGLYYNGTDRFAGFVGYLAGKGLLKNVNITDSYIQSSGAYTGGVLAHNYTAEVKNCDYTGHVIGAQDVGGIIGYQQMGDISDCIFSGTVKGNQNVGGIAGRGARAFTRCAAIGTVIGNNIVAGGIGAAGGTIKDCYVQADVTALNTNNVGGLVCSGTNYKQGILLNCYFAGTVTKKNGVKVEPGTGLIGYSFNQKETYNNYYLLEEGKEAVNVDDCVEGYTAEEFASGMIAYKLGNTFGQKLGTDSYPVYVDSENAIYRDQANGGYKNMEEATLAVQHQIAALPETFTLEDKAQVEAVRAAYDALSEEEREYIKNRIVLLVAEMEIEELVEKQAAEEKAATDKAAADAVKELLASIGDISYTDTSKAEIEAARAAYDALTDDQKALISSENLEILTNAENTYAELKQQAEEEAKKEAEEAKLKAEKKAVQETKITSLKAKKYKSTGIKLTWKKTDNVTHYQIYRSTKKNSGYKRVATVTSAKYTLKKGLGKNKTYYYKVRGYKVIDGKKVYTSFTRIIVSLNKAKAVKAAGISGLKSVTIKGQIGLKWNRPESMYNLKGYKIYKSTKKNSGYKLAATVKGRKATIKKGLKSGKTYYFRVKGYIKVGSKTVYTKAATIKVKAK